MTKQTTPPADTPSAAAASSTVMAVVPSRTVPPQVAAIRESLAAQAKVTTRFDARRFRRKEQR